jgi:hypothetical protein
MTQYRDLFTALAAPFAAGEVKTRPQGGRQLSYVTARTIMNRLDEVLGPENWWDDYVPNGTSVICRLTVRLPDGSTVTKVDAGGEAGMADAGDNDKSGFSDAFKRTAVKFGVGRYLYRDGVATLTSSEPAPPAVAQIPAASAAPKALEGPAPAPAKKTEIKTGLQLERFAESCRIDPCLKGWIVGHFTKLKYPSKISTWSQKQVADALPDVKTHLEAVMAAKKEEAA